MLLFLFTTIILASCDGDNDDGNVSGSPGTLQLVQTSYNASEGTFVNIFVHRSGGNSGVVSVDYTTADGDAVGGSDYTATSGTLTWPDGLSGNLTISIFITGDNTVELPESFTVTLSNVSVATLGANSSATVNIIDSDPLDMMATYSHTCPGFSLVLGASAHGPKLSKPYRHGKTKSTRPSNFAVWPLLALKSVLCNAAKS